MRLKKIIKSNWFAPLLVFVLLFIITFFGFLGQYQSHYYKDISSFISSDFSGILAVLALIASASVLLYASIFVGKKWGIGYGVGLLISVPLFVFLFFSVPKLFLRFIELPKEKACEEQGGRWGKVGFGGPVECNLPTLDAGKECIDSSQCESVCITQNYILPESEIVGKCYKWQNAGGSCLNYVNDGKAFGTLCSD